MLLSVRFLRFSNLYVVVDLKAIVSSIKQTGRMEALKSYLVDAKEFKKKANYVDLVKVIIDGDDNLADEDDE